MEASQVFLVYSSWLCRDESLACRMVFVSIPSRLDAARWWRKKDDELSHLCKVKKVTSNPKCEQSNRS